MKITKNVWTAILLWMALCSFTLSAQVTGTETIELSTLTGSCTITTAGTYHFKGTYSGTPTAPIEPSEGTAVIHVEAEAGNVTIILENVNISLSGEKQCPISARNFPQREVEGPLANSIKSRASSM